MPQATKRTASASAAATVPAPSNPAHPPAPEPPAAAAAARAPVPVPGSAPAPPRSTKPAKPRSALQPRTARMPCRTRRHVSRRHWLLPLTAWLTAWLTHARAPCVPHQLRLHRGCRAVPPDVPPSHYAALCEAAPRGCALFRARAGGARPSSRRALPARTATADMMLACRLSAACLTLSHDAWCMADASASG